MEGKQVLVWEKRYPNTIEFTVKHPDKDGVVRLPSVVDERSVTCFSLYKTKGCEDIKTLIIPETVESIDSIDVGVSNGIVISPNNEWLSTDGNAIFDKEKSKFIKLLVDGIDSYEVPASVFEIGDSAFKNHQSLKSINIHEGVKTIKKAAFDRCKSLETVELPLSLEVIEEFAFAGCEALIIVQGGDNVKTVSFNSFIGTAWIDNEDFSIIGSTLLKINTEKEELIIPDVVKKIDKEAFKQSTAALFNSVVLPEGMEELQGRIFDNCRIVKNIRISSTVKAVDSETFQGGYKSSFGLKTSIDVISKLENIIVDEKNKSYKDVDGVLFSKDGRILVAYPTARTAREYALPRGVEEIAPFAFWGNTSLEKIIMPDSVCTICKRAFEATVNLNEVILSRSLVHISEAAFWGCENLKDIELPDTLETIGYGAFLRSLNEAVVKLPAGLKEISAYAFGGAKELIIPRTSCLTGVGYQKNLITIIDEESGAIQYRVHMNLNDEPEQVEEMMESSWNGACFQFENLDDMFGKFKDMSNRVEIALLRLEYPIDLSSEMKKKYISFIKRNGHKVIKDLIDAGDYKKVEKLIDYGAVADKNREELVVYANKSGAVEIAAKILGTVGVQNNSKGKATLSLDTDIPVLWDTKKQTPNLLGRYRGHDVEVHYPDYFDDAVIKGTQDLKGNNPENYYEIKEVIIPEGYVCLGSNTFRDCVNLTKVTLPSTLESIGNRCFANCKSLKEIVLPEGVQKIGKEAFSGCETLESIALPRSLEWIGEEAFNNCINLREIELGENVRYLGPNCFTTARLRKVVFKGEACSCPEHMCFWYPRYVYTDGDIYALGIPASTHMPLSYLGIETDEIAKNNEKDILSGLTVYGYGTLKAFPKNVDIRFKCISFEDFISSLGGKYSRTCSKKVDLLVTYKIDNKDSTIQKAIANGTAVIEEKDFLEHLSKQKAIDIAAYKPKKEEMEAAEEKKKASKDDPYRPATMKKIWGFKNLDDGTVELTDYKGEDLDIEIPERIGENPVSALGDALFSTLKERRRQDRCAFMKVIEKVRIPESVVKLGAGVFHGCSSLKSINIPQGAKEIPPFTFSDCTALEEIHLPDCIETIGRYAFSDCRQLKSINLKDDITIEGAAFRRCNSLADNDGFIIIRNMLFGYIGQESMVVVPHGVKIISRDAFSEAFSFMSSSDGHCLESIVLPDSVESIEENAFENCTKLKKITTSSNLKMIDSHAFNNCLELRDENGFVIINGILNWYFGEEKEITIPSTVNEVSSFAFTNYKIANLKKIHIPDSVKVINRRAFNTDITIFGAQGSAAEKYAEDNNCKFISE